MIAIAGKSPAQAGLFFVPKRQQVIDSRNAPGAKIAGQPGFSEIACSGVRCPLQSGVGAIPHCGNLALGQGR
jgi:hypothetical protein